MSTITRQCIIRDMSGQPVSIRQGTHVRPLYEAADNDGWNGEIICELMSNHALIAVPADAISKPD